MGGGWRLSTPQPRRQGERTGRQGGRTGCQGGRTGCRGGAHRTSWGAHRTGHRCGGGRTTPVCLEAGCRHHRTKRNKEHFWSLTVMVTSLVLDNWLLLLGSYSVPRIGQISGDDSMELSVYAHCCHSHGIPSVYVLTMSPGTSQVVLSWSKEVSRVTPF